MDISYEDIKGRCLLFYLVKSGGENIKTETTQKIKINKYQNITDAIFDYINNAKNMSCTNIKINKSIISIDYSKELQTIIFSKAKQEFNNIGKNIFKNNKDIIYVSNGDIKECVAKIVRNTEQKRLLSLHMLLFSNLDRIISKGIKIASAKETKGRYQNLKWDYYIVFIVINRKKYIVEFDTLLRERNEQHFRLQRIFTLNSIKKQATATGRVDKQRLDRFSK